MYSKLYERFYSWRLKASASIGEFFAYKANRIYLSISIFFQAFSWFFAYYIHKSLTGDLLVLHYNVDFGIDWIGDSYKIFYFPLVGLTILFLSLLLLVIFGPGKHFRFQSNVAMISNLLGNLGMMSALLLVYLINFK